MGFIAKRYEPNIEYVKNRLRHCFNFDHLSPEQGIAILIGLEPEDDFINVLCNFGNVTEEWRYFERGIQLLNGDVIGGDPISYEDEDQDGNPLNFH